MENLQQFGEKEFTFGNVIEHRLTRTQLPNIGYKTKTFHLRGRFSFQIVAARLRSLRTDDPLNKGHSGSIN